ncbi:hypothetical protein WA577_001985 [Blastocystis sp. JDR]
MFTSFRLEKCDQLRTLLFGRKEEFSQCFHKCNELRVENLPSLERVEVGIECFFECNDVSFSNLPRLVSLVFGWFAFFGELNQLQMKRHFISRPPHRVLVMRNLPLLEIVRMKYCFVSFDPVVIENVSVDMNQSGMTTSMIQSSVYVTNSPKMKELLGRSDTRCMFAE